MLTLATAPPVPSPVTLADAREWLGLSTQAQDGPVAALLAAATELAEGFLGVALIERAVTERLPADGGWRALGREPVREITAMVALTGGGLALLPPTGWAADIDAGGTGHVRVLDAGRARVVEVAYRAGLAADPDGVPIAIRQGILQLAAARHRARDAGVEEAAAIGSSIPAAVLALWRPWRRLTLGGVRRRA